MYQLVLTLLLCWLALPVLAQQQLAKARQSSYLTKVFRLTTPQAQRLYERGLQAARPDFFTQAVDSFPSDKPAGRRLPLGYYLVAHTEGPELVYWLRAETSRTLQVIDNQTDLTLAVRDSLGQLLADAQVAVSGRPLPYDPATRTYRRARPSPAGIVAVTAGGRTTFHPLQQTYRQPQGHWRAGRALRIGSRVLFGPPLGYLTRPVWQTVRGLRHPSRTIAGPVGLVRSAFSENVRDERASWREQRKEARTQRHQQQWQGYLLVSQPRYRPAHDTLRLKARVLRRRDGRPSTQPLTLWLSGGGLPGRKRLASLRPVRPGSYEYSLPLTDTLGLRVGNVASLSLEDTPGHALAEGSFGFEDYELNNNHFSLRMLEKEPRRGQPQAVFLRGSDASELNLLDARVRLVVVPQSGPGGIAGRQLFLPDTLWTHTQLLDPVGETRVNLPARIFPNTGLRYEVRATFLTADNERHVESTHLLYQLDPGRLHAALVGDSVRLSYDSLGLARPHRATLEIARVGYAPSDSAYLERRPVRLPLALPVNPQAPSYTVRDAAGRTAGVALQADNADFTLASARTADSLRLAVVNPHGLPFWYYVYRGNELRYRGYTTAYQLAIKESNVTTWHVSLHYVWGGQLRDTEYSVGPVQRALHIATDEPAIAYPGQRLRLGFVVTDEHGRPVPDADLSAYAYNSKFGQSTLPEIPDTAPPVPGRLARQRFALTGGFGRYEAGRQRLAWPQWRNQLGLDSLQFYHFLYPASGAFYEYRPAPGGLTQVAAFVVDSGRVQAPIAIYVDDQPAYIHDVNQDQPYVAVADSGHHSLSIRTANRLITLRDVYLKAQHKLTLSLDPNLPCTELEVEKRPAELLPDELLALRRTLVAVSNQAAATLRQGPVLRPLATGYASQYHEGFYLAGPFRPDSVLLRPLGEGAAPTRANGGRRKFLFEPLYSYQFSPGVVKMLCLDPSQLGPLNGAGLPDQLPLADFAYTEALLRPWEHLPAAKKSKRKPGRVLIREPYRGQPKLTYPSSTTAGRGRLQLLLPDSLAQPLYVLLTRPDQPKFQRLQPVYALLHDLPAGRYRVAVLLADSSCLLPQDLALVQANGQTYYHLRRADRQRAAALSHRLNQWLRRLTPPPPPVREQVVAPDQRQLKLMQPGKSGAHTRLLRGRVVGHDTEEGLPGVTVLVKGTALGTSTGPDGSFTLHVPLAARALVLSSVGYVTQERLLDKATTLEITLSESTQELSEVVVMGAGAPDYSPSYSGSATSMVERSLQGRVAGVSISGAPAQVLIRGVSSVTAGEQPLYIVNGLPFIGRLADISPSDIQEMKVLKGPEAMSIYGARASAGVVLITLKTGSRLAGPPAGAPDLLPGADPRLALRRHFSDHAWWRPTLVTDAQGRAHADVVLPDDITSWDTFVIGSDDHRRLGTATGRVRAFKSLLATLSGPRFLLAGDQVQLLGKALNYQPDTAQLTTTFRVGGQVVRRQAHRVSTAFIDTLRVTAPAAADSLQIAFGLEQASGYADGEQRSLPVLPVGTRERVGTYAVLTAADTTLALPLDPSLGEVRVRLEADALPTLLAEIHHLQEYAYLCNEQAASRLLALLLEQRICTMQEVPFKYERIVNFLIKKLLDGRHQPEGIWGTWPNSEVSPWATAHVVEALLAAEKLGYTTGLVRAPLHAYLLHELDESLSKPTPSHQYTGYFRTDDDQIRLLKLLHDLAAPADYGTYLRRLEASRTRRPALDRYLALTELRQQLGLSYQLDSLRRYRLRTELGGASYGDTLRTGTYYRYLLDQRVGTTLLAYRLLRQQGGHAAELARIRTFLLGLRGGGYWSSTYEAAQILLTIGPDLLVPGSGGKAAQVQLSGSPALPVGPITQFPLALTLPAGTGTLTLRKQGGLPVYATAYQTRWNAAPAAAAAPFVVHATLAGQASGRVALPAGQPAELEVTVEVKAEVRYALLEIPIPAGCSYGPPTAPNYVEVHREYLKHQVGIFIDNLPAGKHTFRVALQPRYQGSYTLNPARLEMIYFPTKYGRTAGKRVNIK
ncbi:MAG: carboxypeptidase-like regulatory domain-containing protein [Janthinobacterium lividum]